MNCIEEAMRKEPDISGFLYQFFLHPLPLEVENQYEETALELYSEKAIAILIEADIEEIIDIVGKHRDEIQPITTMEIPMFNDLHLADEIPGIVFANPGIDYLHIGYYLSKNGSYNAKIKYGETHYKAASALGLVKVGAPYFVTSIGKKWVHLGQKDRDLLRPKLCLRVPIIQKFFVEAHEGTVYAMDFLCSMLTASTAARRRSSIKQMIHEITDTMPPSDKLLYESRIVWKLT